MLGRLPPPQPLPPQPPQNVTSTSTPMSGRLPPSHPLPPQPPQNGLGGGNLPDIGVLVLVTFYGV